MELLLPVEENSSLSRSKLLRYEGFGAEDEREGRLGRASSSNSSKSSSSSVYGFVSFFRSSINPIVMYPPDLLFYVIVPCRRVGQML